MGSDDAGQQMQQQAMTAERLAHWQWLIAKHHEPQSISSVVIGVRDLEAFVAEVERQRAALDAAEAREAALLEVVERVATMLYIPLTDASGVTTREICGGCARSFRRDDSGWFSEDSRHAPECVVTQARALLASTAERSGGDGA